MNKKSLLLLTLLSLLAGNQGRTSTNWFVSEHRLTISMSGTFQVTSSTINNQQMFHADTTPKQSVTFRNASGGTMNEIWMRTRQSQTSGWSHHRVHSSLAANATTTINFPFTSFRINQFGTNLAFHTISRTEIFHGDPRTGGSLVAVMEVDWHATINAQQGSSHGWLNWSGQGLQRNNGTSTSVYVPLIEHTQLAEFRLNVPPSLSATFNSLGLQEGTLGFYYQNSRVGEIRINEAGNSISPWTPPAHLHGKSLEVILEHGRIDGKPIELNIPAGQLIVPHDGPRNLTGNITTHPANLNETIMIDGQERRVLQQREQPITVNGRQHLITQTDRPDGRRIVQRREIPQGETAANRAAEAATDRLRAVLDSPRPPAPTPAPTPTPTPPPTPTGEELAAKLWGQFALPTATPQTIRKYNIPETSSSSFWTIAMPGYGTINLDPRSWAFSHELASWLKRFISAILTIGLLISALTMLGEIQKTIHLAPQIKTPQIQVAGTNIGWLTGKILAVAFAAIISAALLLFSTYINTMAPEHELLTTVQRLFIDGIVSTPLREGLSLVVFFFPVEHAIMTIATWINFKLFQISVIQAFVTAKTSTFA